MKLTGIRWTAAGLLKGRNPADPVGPDEWQQAVDLAELGLLLDACRQYGLITGGPEFDLGRCEDIVRRARRHGIAYPASPEELVRRYLLDT